MRKPFFWKKRQGWYVKSDDGRTNIFLAIEQEEAYTKWGVMRAAGASQLDRHAVPVVLDRYIVEGLKGGEHHQRRFGLYLKQAADQFAKLAAIDLTPHMVTKWIESRETWGASSQRSAIQVLKAVWKWATEQRLLSENKLLPLKKPEDNTRDTVITNDEHVAMCLAADKNHYNGRARGVLRIILIALKHSGTRPGMIAAIEAKNVAKDFSTWTFQHHKTRKKIRRPLVVYLSPCAQTLTRILVAARPTGKLFRNGANNPWEPNFISNRVYRLRLRLKLRPGVIAYAYRHTFATTALEKEIPIATVAALLGHTSARMVMEKYGHLDKANDHLKDAAKRAMG